MFSFDRLSDNVVDWIVVLCLVTLSQVAVVGEEKREAWDFVLAVVPVVCYYRKILSSFFRLVKVVLYRVRLLVEVEHLVEFELLTKVI